jgi:hypothetical protein
MLIMMMLNASNHTIYDVHDDGGWRMMVRVGAMS